MRQQSAPHRMPPLEQIRPQRCRAQAEHLRRVRRCKALQIHKVNDFALSFRKLLPESPNHGRQPLAVHATTGIGLVQYAVRDRPWRRRKFRSTHAGPAQMPGDASRDLVEPDSECPRPAILPEVSQCEDKGLLNHIFRFIGIGGKRERPAKDLWLHRRDEAREGVEVAVARLRDQRIGGEGLRIGQRHFGKRSPQASAFTGTSVRSVAVNVRCLSDLSEESPTAHRCLGFHHIPVLLMKRRINSRRWLLATAAASILTGCGGQRADGAFEPHVAARSFPSDSGPQVCIDEAHFNAHTMSGLFAPFAALLRADGYRPVPLHARLEGGFPQHCDVLVIANAAGGRTYKLFGLNLPTKSRERRPNAAFSPTEIESVRAWVERGGALLLIADHYPYGAAAASLARAFGVDMSQGFTEAAHSDPSGRDPGQLVYSTENGLLGVHPIVTGRSDGERVGRVVTFTGQSLRAEQGTPLLILGDSAVDFVPPPPQFTPRPATGRNQGLAVLHGSGRLVVLSEAAVVTAQLGDQGRPFGMRDGENDNAQFALNIMHWLSRLLPEIGSSRPAHLP